MKNINFKATLISFVVAFVIAFAFTACGGADTATEQAAPAAEEVVAEEVVACADDCQKACCLGCKATEGEKSCDLLALGDHSCCAPAEETHDHGPEGHSH